jgi:hypothetical protein
MDLTHRADASRVHFTFSPSALEAHGLEPPQAGDTIFVKLTVTRAATEDVDADGDVDLHTIEAQPTAIAFEVEALPISRHLASRAAAGLYGQRAQKWLKVGERNIGGSPAIGEFGAFNRRVGA